MQEDEARIMIIKVTPYFIALLDNDCEECSEPCDTDKKIECWQRVNDIANKIEELKNDIRQPEK